MKTRAPIALFAIALFMLRVPAAFVSLAPDTYTLSIAAKGYESVLATGVTVFADQIQHYDAALTPSLRVIGSTRATTTGLVRRGQTSDVYTLDPQQTQNAQALGGGGGLYQTYSALASVPGVYVPQYSLNQGQNNSAPFIRGGNFTQVGYEFDGVPVQREYDGYVGTTQGTTGQQELQVYTGGGSASAASEALAGYVNQVIKTGTYPGGISLEGALGSPSYYHFLRAEANGATRDGRFSFYLGNTAWSQFYRYADPFNGGNGPNPTAQALVPWNASFFPLTPSEHGAVFPIPYAAGPAAGPSDMQSRETVANVHVRFGKNNGDDIQLLADIGRQPVVRLGGQELAIATFAVGATIVALILNLERLRTDRSVSPTSRRPSSSGIRSSPRLATIS